MSSAHLRGFVPCPVCVCLRVSTDSLVRVWLLMAACSPPPTPAPCPFSFSLIHSFSLSLSPSASRSHSALLTCRGPGTTSVTSVLRVFVYLPPPHLSHPTPAPLTRLPCVSLWGRLEASVPLQPWPRVLGRPSEGPVDCVREGTDRTPHREVWVGEGCGPHSERGPWCPQGT